MKIFTSTAIILAALAIAGCHSEIEKEPMSIFTSQTIKKAAEIDPNVLAGNVRSMYTNMFKALGNDDFGQKGNDIYSDMLSGDMVMTHYIYGWYQSITQLQATTDYTRYENNNPWSYYYRIVFLCNNVISSLGGNDVADLEGDGKIYMGQAKGMRGYAYFYLTQLYTKGDDDSEKILPLPLTKEDANKPQVTTGEVYDQIIKDLTEAITLLSDFKRANKSEMNDDVAKLLLAYVYGERGNFGEVKKLTEQILDKHGKNIMSANEVVGGFRDVNTPGWLWGVDLTKDIGLNLFSWWGQVDIYSYSYASVGDTKVINRDLYDAIDDDDIRKGQFILNDASLDSKYDLAPAGKFYPEVKKITGQRTITTDYVYMRVAEAKLLYAEALAKTGDIDAAKSELKDFMALRITAGESKRTYKGRVDGMDAKEVEDEIYLQTRIEFWGEGKSYLAMKRNRATVTYGSNHLEFPGQQFIYNDNRLIFEVPQQEVQNNPNVDKK